MSQFFRNRIWSYALTTSPPELDQSSDEEPVFVELITRARNGDQAALGRLVEKYRNYLLLIANTEIDQQLRGKVGASDVVQHSIMQAMQHFDQFRGGAEPELLAWLRKILVNDLRKTRRDYAAEKRNAAQEVNLQEHSALGRQLQDRHLTPSSDALKNEKLALVQQALESLSPDHRQVIQLRVFEQLSFQEVSLQMNRNAVACRKLWSRAIQSLKIVLGKSAPDLLTGVHPPADTHD